MTNYEIIKADIIEWAKNYQGPKFHAAFCDAPYELEFMGKSWDSSGISFQKETWELIRQHLYPGAFLFCFGGTRTYHRIAVAIEDAGFEIRDTIAWVQGQGFPKSYNIAKGIEGKLTKGSANWNNWKELDGERRGGNLGYTKSQAEQGYRPDDYTGRGSAFDLDAKTEMGQVWEGYGTALKPSFEPVIVAMNPVDESFVNNALEHGVSGLNIDAGRIGVDENDPVKKAKFVGHNPGTAGHTMGNGWKEQGDNVSMWSGKGRWPANFILSHHSDCRIIGEKDGESYTINRWSDGAKPFGGGAGHEFDGEKVDSGKEYVWECVEECAVRRLGEQSGESKSSSKPRIRDGNGTELGQGSGWNRHNNKESISNQHGDSGTAARFFYQPDWSYEIMERIENADPFFYCAKANKAERDIGLNKEYEEVPYSKYRKNYKTTKDFVTHYPDGSLRPVNPIKNPHTTVKPISLNKYLASLLLPPSHYAPDRRILIPFAGVASEMIGAIMAGWDEVVGVELDSENAYIEIANKRLKFWSEWIEKGVADPKEIIKLQKKIDKEIEKSENAEHFNLFGTVDE